MKRTSKVPVVFGIILFVIAFLIFLFTIGSNDSSTRLGGLILALLFFIPCIILFISAGVSSNRVQKENEEFSQKYEDKRFVTTCFNCGHEVTARAEQFAQHRNYPEGFIYCPICRKPLSIRAFKVVYKDQKSLPPDFYVYDFDDLEDD